MDDGKSLFTFQCSFNNHTLNFLKSYQRLIIYLPRESCLFANAGKLIDHALKARIVLKKYFGPIKVAFTNESLAI